MAALSVNVSASNMEQNTGVLFQQQSRGKAAGLRLTAKFLTVAEQEPGNAL